MSERGVRALSIRARELGRHLRWAEEQSGMNGKTLAYHLGWSETRLSRTLSGRASTRALDVSAFLGVCGVTGVKREMILRLSQPYVDDDLLRLPSDECWDSYLAHAGEAATVFEYQPSMIPWAAQAPDYTRAVLSAVSTAAQEPFERNLVARRGAVSLLQRPRVCLVLDESALHCALGTAEVMSDQLHHLLRLSVRKTLSIRVLPGGVGSPLLAGGFALLAFSDYDTFVYREEPTAGVFIAAADDVHVYRNVLRGLDSVALDEDHTRDLISKIAAEFSDNMTTHSTSPA
jgi:hypothetical protein